MSTAKQVTKENMLYESVTKWKDNEEGAIRKLEEFMQRIENPIVRMLVSELIHDSRKHADILSTLAETIRVGHPIISYSGVVEKGGIEMSPEELKDMTDDIGKHIRIEEDIISEAQEAMEDLKNPVIRYLFNHIIQDEEKHHEILKNLLVWPYTGRWWESPVEFKLQTLRDKRGVGYEADRETREKMGLL